MFLRRWIAQGAEYAPHWALIAPKALPLPKVADKAWPRNGIDFWILDRLQRDEGLKPSPEAEPTGTASPRAASISAGLPPTLEEVERFVADTAPDAYEKAVDRFLDDPAYGERWARMWLDQARYADSAGYGSDPLRPNIWRYRDWVIDAFNRNLPFDQFTLEQIAGDLLPEPSLEQQIATAFHRNTMTNTEGGTDDEEFRVAAIKDRVDTTMQVWMGLTMGCAKCHSHKFDPITHEEYYKFYAIFNQTADNDQPDESPVLPRRRRALPPRSRGSMLAWPACEKSWRRPPEARRCPGQVGREPELGELGRAKGRAEGRPECVLDVPAEKRTKPQAELLARHFESIAPELKPVRDKIAALEKAGRRSRRCR